MQALAVSLATGLCIAADALDASVSAALAPILPRGAVLFRQLPAGASMLGLLWAEGD